MRAQKEYMDFIKNEFVFNIKHNGHILDAYCYRDNRACDLIKRFKENVNMCGLNFSNCHHANGIGNNNEYMIFIETKDNDGFVIRKNVASFYYCYGIYRGCYVKLKDLVTNEEFIVGKAI